MNIETIKYIILSSDNFTMKLLSIFVFILVIFDYILLYIKHKTTLKKEVESIKTTSKMINILADFEVKINDIETNIVQISESLKILNKVIDNKVLNNIPSDLISLLYHHTKGLSDNMPDKALRTYYNNKINTIINAYKYIRDSGDIGIINNIEFEKNFLGDPQSELEGLYKHFNSYFLVRVREINEKSFYNFKNNLALQQNNENFKDKGIWELLKALILPSVSENLETIMIEYKRLCE